MIHDALATSPIFEGIDRDILALLAGAAETVTVPAGTVLFAQGEAGDAAYVVLNGRLRVSRIDGTDSHHIRDVGRGGLVGEFSMLTGAARTATVTALRDAEVARIPVERFRTIVTSHPTLSWGIARGLAQLVGEPRTPRVVHSSTVVGVNGGHRHGFLPRLAAALGRHGRVAVISAQSAEAAGVDLTDHGSCARWLQSLEQRHAYVLCDQAEAGAPWHGFCFRHADRLLEVVHAESAVCPPATPALAGVRRDVVLLHDRPVRRGRDTHRWLDMGYAARHHVHREAEADVARVARDLAGARIGLVLGGGGARGLAHAGVLRAMRELGIPIDEIGGTSIGALIASQWSLGFSPEEIAERHRDGWRRWRPHRAFTLPLIGLVSHDPMTSMLTDWFGDACFADGWIDAYAVSCNLTTATAGVHRSGSIRDACMASMAIPGLGPAYTMPDRSLHVDGGVVCNLPVEHLRAKWAIASDVARVKPVRSGYERTPSAWRVLRDRWFGTTPPYYPSLYTTIALSTVVGSIRTSAVAARQADVYMHSTVPDTTLLEFDRVDAAVKTGYETALPALAAWWDTHPLRT